MAGQTIQAQMLAGRLLGGLCAATCTSLIVVASAAGDDSALGAPAVWPWLLTGLQVLSLWSAGRRHWWGWLMGGCVQLPWIAYALMTDQVGFVPGCLISALVQLSSFLRISSRTAQMEVVT